MYSQVDRSYGILGTAATTDMHLQSLIRALASSEGGVTMMWYSSYLILVTTPRSCDSMPPRLAHAPDRSGDMEARTNTAKGSSHADGYGTCTTLCDRVD